MAEAFLQVVLDNLSTLVKEEIGLILGVDDEMKKLSSTLTTVQAVLEDAELKQIESRPIRDWLKKVNALAYEIDDILDDCNTHVSKLNNSGSKLKKILYRHKMGRRMKQVTERLDAVAAEREKFHLREMPVDRPREVAAASRETSSLLKEADTIYGREEDRDKTVKMLVEDVREKQEMSVLPIIGVGGLGKTTLAQLVYNDPRVADHFERRIWVCVSDNFDIKTLVKGMIESATGSAKDSELQSKDALERRLWELLSQKRYLIVLDDVWNEQQEKWLELKSILSCGSNGASIIVTTRLKMVADIMGTLPSHSLKGISDEDCWMLLKQRAFGQQHHQEEEVKFPELQEIGKEIVKKCGGVPLAAKALGGILRFKRIAKEWMYVRDSDTWKLSPEDNLIMPALRLSYHHLPLKLRQCFAYFAAFPKDDVVNKEELIRMWIAHGYISSKGTQLQVEDVGNEICNELLLRSLLQSSSDDDVSMHDLVHDLAQSVMENKVPGIQSETNTTSASSSTIRQVNLLERYVMFPRTFQQDMDIYSIMELTSLRVLHANNTRIKSLPPSIATLKHLRHLDLSYSQISTLPNSLCSLWNLQILNLNYCGRLVALPKKMRYLRNLQHLCLEDCELLSEMPSSMRELTRLKTLSRFVVGPNKGSQLEELECLNLSGRLELRHLERVKDHLDAKKANLAEKKNLRDLSLCWNTRSSLSKLGEDVDDEKVLEALEPHPNLEYLFISGYGGRCFPLWMTNSTLGKIVSIYIMNCKNCRRLPKLGELPHLKRLSLDDVGVEYIIEEDEVGSGNLANILFLALEHLDLSHLPNLRGIWKEQESKVWMPNSTMGKIVEIEIMNCPNLRRLPQLGQLPHLRRLSLGNVGMEYIIEEDEVGRGNTVGIQFQALEMLSLRDLPNLRGIWKEQESKEAFPNLKNLKIEGCSLLMLPPLSSLKKLEDLECSSSTLDLFSKLDSLTRLEVRIEETTTCFPIEALARFANLRELVIDGAKEISVPVEGLQTLKALEELDIRNCSCIPEGLLQHLTALEFLDIWSCPELVELPEEIKHLHNLQHIDLIDLPKMACLPEALHHLSSLRRLGLHWLPELESLPVGLHQLTSLTLVDCPKLVSLPPAILSNLKYLNVEECPELERRCKRGSGDYWPMIAHIPKLRIADE